MAKKPIKFKTFAEDEVEVGMDAPSIPVTTDADAPAGDYLEAEREALGSEPGALDVVTPTVTIITPSDAHDRQLSPQTLAEMTAGREALKQYAEQLDEYGRPLSAQTLAEMAGGREALKAYAGYVEPFAGDVNGQQRGNFEAPRLQFVETDNNAVPKFTTSATPYIPGQE